MSESKLTQIRREKHQHLNGGTYPLANGKYSRIDILLDLCLNQIMANYLPFL